MPILTPTRRDIMAMAAAAPALALPRLARADLHQPPAANPGHMSFTLGEARLTVISDGALHLPASGLGVNADPAEVRAFLERHYLSPETQYAHTNHLVVDMNDTRLLVDVGSGNRFLDTAGRLMPNLGAAGIDPSSITHVMITHAHPDHIWGIRDDFDESILPGAACFLGEREHRFWMQDGLAARVAPEVQSFVVGARNAINAEGADWTLIADGAEIAPGIRAIATPGHTPGHMSLLIESGAEPLLVTGDALNHAWMNFAHPGWYNGFDMDGAQTVATRRRLLDMAATGRMAVLGYHFPFPGVGHVMREADSYRFIPALWKWD
ncbi:metallo-beta-lactamase [Salipiger aestuarii]|uniref:MBL fold metallo-hydrolase n=1 Tax=Salipiger aestuarii TaxID=568098 RepID=UPI00123A1B34|nr:MBL fold metallo-hydrolase [Salipiger aestuarii]KAA8607651.1 metallo-beta-lactamase [Salipiger aestuarii]KAA8611112.1 metallo-beta-lactamase [Salipiger aestuarii]